MSSCPATLEPSTLANAGTAIKASSTGKHLPITASHQLLGLAHRQMSEATEANGSPLHWSAEQHCGLAEAALPVQRPRNDETTLGGCLRQTGADTPSPVNLAGSGASQQLSRRKASDTQSRKTVACLSRAELPVRAVRVAHHSYCCSNSPRRDDAL